MDRDTYLSLTIEQRAEWATHPGPVAPELLEIIVEDHVFVVGTIADANLSEDNLAMMYQRVADPVIRGRVATNPRAPLALLAQVPLKDHTGRSLEAFLTRLGPGIIDHPGVIDAVSGPWIDERPIIELVRQALGYEVELPE